MIRLVFEELGKNAPSQPVMSLSVDSCKTSLNLSPVISGSITSDALISGSRYLFFVAAPIIAMIITATVMVNTCKKMLIIVIDSEKVTRWNLDATFDVQPSPSR